jgi:hypothetical protein
MTRTTPERSAKRSLPLPSAPAHHTSRRPGIDPERPLPLRQPRTGAHNRATGVGRRTPVLLAAGVLALSTATPAAVLATEPDHQQEGTAAPEQVTANDAPTSPDIDPGGDSSDLPFDAAPAPAPVAPDPADDTDVAEQGTQAPPDPADDTGPLEPQPPPNEDAPVADPEDATGTQNTGQQPPPATTDLPAPPTANPTEPTAVPQPPPSAPALEPAAATPSKPTTADDPPSRARKPDKRPQTRPQTRVTVPAQTLHAAQPQPIDPSSRASAPPTVPIAVPEPINLRAAVSQRRAAQRGDRHHVVQRGESLWSIAKDLLGNDASTARIAREVERLWQLNKARIGTGNPDLLIAGTRLVLP